MALCPPSSDPIAQGLPTSSGSAFSALFFPLRKEWPMGWIGGRYSTSKFIEAIYGSHPSTSLNVPCAPGVNEQERGKISYQAEKPARSRPTLTASSFA